VYFKVLFTSWCTKELF